MYMMAGMMAREYGQTPTEILGIDGLPRGERFHLDFDIFKATSDRIHEAQEQQKEEAKSGGVANRHQQKKMAQGKESRAKQRESMQQAGMNAPSPDGQMSQLDQIMAEREEAKQMRDGEVNEDG